MLYVDGKGITNDKQKRALLLHVAGMEVQEIYFTLTGEDGSVVFADTLKVLDDYFVPKANIPFERHLFRQIAQDSSETVDQFLCTCFVSERLTLILAPTKTITFVIDYFSRFLEVAIMKSTTSSKVIEAMTPMFARFGVPFSLRTDNGPQFVSEEFETFLRTHGVQHQKTAPLWPQANGEVERQNRSLLKCLQIAHLEGKNWRTELTTWLAAYRSTPQTTTGATPF